MSKMIPVHNSTEMPLYVSGAMVPPDETKHFPEHQVPAHLRPQQAPAAAPEAVDPIAVILAHKAPDIEAMLPGMSDEDLQALKQGEENGKARKGLLAAIAEDELRRADVKAGGDAQPGDAEQDADKGDDGDPEDG